MPVAGRSLMLATTVFAPIMIGKTISPLAGLWSGTNLSLANCACQANINGTSLKKRKGT